MKHALESRSDVLVPSVADLFLCDTLRSRIEDGGCRARKAGRAGANRKAGYPPRVRGEKRWSVPCPHGLKVIQWGEAMRLWGEAMRLRLIPWGEAIENY